MISFFSIAVLMCIGINLPICYSQRPTTGYMTRSVLCDPIPICKKSKYRTINGQCNNLEFPLRGAAQTQYLRVVPSNYADGLSKFPTDSTGQPLPSARLVSFTLFPFKPNFDPIWNLNSMQFGQIVAHDMSLTAMNHQTIKEPIVCCDENNQPTANVSQHPCIPIWIPINDPVHPSDGNRCLDAIRTLMDIELPCVKSNKTADQINEVTAYADLSVVYGSTDAQAEPLRERVGGLLVTNEILEREFPPQAANVTSVCDMARSPNEPCFVSGDVRVNQNPQLALLQVIFHRDHNKIARNLKSLNPHWNDEIVFQEARRIAIAKYQHILYYEWLPTFLGFNNLVKFKLIHPGAKGYINDYNNGISAAVSNEHATASLRDPHKWVKGHLLELTESRRFLEKNIRLSDFFNKPEVITEDDRFDNFVRGMTCQARGSSDQFFDPEITTFLFKRNRTVGEDLRALDIQRGRDHGIGTYVSTRAHFKLSVPKTFSDLRNDISEENIIILSSLYKSVNDVDLSVAGALENIVPGTAFGPTFLEITIDQFARSRFGDRYFYENGADPLTAFTLDQLTELRKASMARLLCDNSDNVRNMQRKAFQQISKDNELVPCDSIPEVDLKFWMDTSKRGKRERRRRNRSCQHCCC